MLRNGMLYLGLCGVLAGCSDPSGPRTPTEPVREFTVQERDVARANTSFGLHLLRNIHENSTGNLLLSPLSVSMALGMTLNGAANTTFEAMRNTLAFDPALQQPEINAAYNGLLRQLRARASRIEFVVANSIWYHQTFPVYPTFTDTVRHYFDAEVRALDFGNAASPGIISDWAEERTAGRIKDLVESIDPNEIMFLVNAVYFKAPWHMRFAQSETRAQPFTLPNGGSVNAQMMFVDGTFSYVENQGVQAVELLYGDTTFSIVLVMPRTGSSLDAATSILEPTQWGALISSMHRSRINLRIPKFRFEYEKELTQPLSDLGMAIAFQPFQADFTKIANRDDIYISRVQHKAFIEVNEAGTEAAAATSVGISVTSAPPELVFNRPFFFAIRERSTGTLLFVGRIADPTQTE